MNLYVFFPPSLSVPLAYLHVCSRLGTKVDRQVRLVEQAIRDQELVIAHEVRPGTHPTPIVLADITAPQKYTRPTRVSFSPIRSFHDYVDPPSDLELEEDAVVDVLGQEEQQPPESSEKGSKKGKKDSKGGEKGQKSMIIRIPAQRLSEPRTSSEPGEAIWCYCKMPESQDQQDRPVRFKSFSCYIFLWFSPLHALTSLGMYTDGRMRLRRV